MQEFFHSTKAKVLLAIFILLGAFMLRAIWAGGFSPMASQLLGALSAPVQGVTADISNGVSDRLYQDLNYYDTFFSSHRDQKATKVANTANDTYLRTSGVRSGIGSYAQVCDLLVNWHIQTVVLPSIAVEESQFDPYDESQVDLSGIVNAG